MTTTASGPATVNDALTPNRPAASTRTDRPGRRSRRRRSEVENPDYAAFARRIIRAHGRRVAGGDVEGLAELVDLAADVDAATQAAVDGLREFGYSWGEIASRLGTSRQAAQQRWGKAAR
jgi:hypothetical protein